MRILEMLRNVLLYASAAALALLTPIVVLAVSLPLVLAAALWGALRRFAEVFVEELSVCCSTAAEGAVDAWWRIRQVLRVRRDLHEKG